MSKLTQLTQRLSAWHPRMPFAVKPSPAPSVLIGCGSARGSVLSPGSGAVPRPPCSRRGDGLRGDNVDLIQVGLTEVLVVAKRVVKV